MISVTARYSGSKRDAAANDALVEGWLLPQLCAMDLAAMEGISKNPLDLRTVAGVHEHKPGVGLSLRDGKKWCEGKSKEDA